MPSSDVIWQCKDYADGWISFPSEREAATYQAATGCAVRTVPHPAPTAADTPEDAGPTQREEWLAAQAALDRNSVLLLEKQLSSAHETIRAKDEALRDVRPIITSLIARGYNVDTWKLNRVLENIDAALTPLPEGGK